MNITYNNLIGASMPLILLGGLLLGAINNPEMEVKQKSSVQKEVFAQAEEGGNTEVQMVAGIEAVLEEAYAESIQGENTEEEMTATEESGIALAMEASGEAIESEESEYSDFAIANVTNYVNVRTEPNTDSEIVGKMYDNSVAQILSVVGEGEEEWFQVISGEVEGYIKSEYFIYGDAAAEVIDDYVTRYVVVKADRLNVRKEPDITAARIGYKDFGEKAKLLEYGEEWSKILYTEGEEGYVASEYVTIEEHFTYAKSIEEEQKELEAQLLLAQRAQESETATPENTTIQVTPPPTDYASVSELRTAIVNYAMQYLGNRYVSGGRSLETGTDCSGFTCYVYAVFGYSLSRTPQGQWGSNGRNITVEEAQPGDIVCYGSKGGRCTHVGLYIGNGQIIHSANSRKGVIISDIYYDNTFIGIKNVID